jgi:hypothetical protein
MLERSKADHSPDSEDKRKRAEFGAAFSGKHYDGG